jgi:hypothetical protein
MNTVVSPFENPCIDSAFAIPSTNRSVVTVSHRSGEIRNKSGPYSALLFPQVGLVIVKLPDDCARTKQTPPPFPPDSGSPGAVHDEKHVSVITRLPPLALPVIVPYTAPPQTESPVTLHSLNVQPAIVTARFVSLRVTSIQLPFPPLREIDEKFVSDSSHAATAASETTAAVESVTDEQEHVLSAKVPSSTTKNGAV